MPPLHCVFVNSPDPEHSLSQNYGARFMPVWGYTLAAHAPDDGRFTFELLDLQARSVDSLEHADILMFSGINQDFDSLSRTRRRLARRFPDAPTLVGGPIAWSYDQAGALDELSSFDHICIGDGELLIVELLDTLAQRAPLPHIVRSERRFALGGARPMHRPLLQATVGDYYGAVLEVSRGCPFLCEFCDIRIMSDNNRSHVVPPEHIVAELDELARHGVHKVTFACDNFIGDQRWAEAVCDALIAWQSRADRPVSIYTWVTINLYKHTRLMDKMRRAGFDLLFIGIESFNANALLETAKVQNRKIDLARSVADIQARGFVVIAGLIFGFDADGSDFAEVALEGLLKSGLISGDPNWLTALPGTPLHRRMRLSGRLRQSTATHGGHKYQTNIRYLLPRRVLHRGFERFVATYTSGDYQLRRFERFMAILARGDYVPSPTDGGFGDTSLFLRQTVSRRAAVQQMARRLATVARDPDNVLHMMRGLRTAYRYRGRLTGWFGYFQFWVFVWTNALFKYRDISAEDLDLLSVRADYDVRRILPEGYDEIGHEPIPANKSAAQRRATRSELLRVIAAHELPEP